MSPIGKFLYRIGEFSFDTEQNILLHEGKPISLTPKMLELLRVLVENHGRILKKDDLLETVWADSFVEEGNLKFTINQLRKVLGDDAHNPQYIETIPRRGYRFIAETEEILVENEKTTNSSKINPVPQNNFNLNEINLSRGLQILKNRWVLIGFSFFLLISSLAFTSWFFKGDSNRASDIPLLSAPRRSEPLSYSNNIFGARISPDGKYITYIVQNQGKQTIWLRELATITNLQLLPYSDERYSNLMFSSKSDFIYFVRKPTGGSQDESALFRISIFGGIPTKLITGTQGWFSLSPLDDKIAFTRNEPQGRSLLVISDADGKNQKTLAVRDKPHYIHANRWSPDGLFITCAIGQSDNLANEFGLVTIDAATGEEKKITPRKFYYISDLEWLPDQSGLLFTARENNTPNNQIWHLFTDSSEAIKLLDDATNYTTISLDKEAKQMVATQVFGDFNLSIADFADPNNYQISIPSGNDRVCFTGNGKILYTTFINGYRDISIMNVDGTGQRQLTSDALDNFYPRESPDGKYIFFSSNRSGSAQIWRMNADGSSQIQITQKEGGFPLAVSSDGKSLFYLSAINRNLWQVSVDGGNETLLLDKRVLSPAFSRNGQFAAFFYRRDENSNFYRMDVISVETKRVIASFDQVNEAAFPVQIVWANDEKSVFYASTADLETTLWQQKLVKRTPQKITSLSSKVVQDFSLSPAGDKLAIVSGEWKHYASLLKGLK